MGTGEVEVFYLFHAKCRSLEESRLRNKLCLAPEIFFLFLFLFLNFFLLLLLGLLV